MTQYRSTLPVLLMLTCILWMTPARAQSPSTASSLPQKGGTMSFALKTTAFTEGGEIPAKYTCTGADVSPNLSWQEPPGGTQSLALTMDDPDAPVGTWTHWVIWNIPAKTTTLPEGVTKHETLRDGIRQGNNDFKRIGYGGPCPPPASRTATSSACMPSIPSPM